MVPPSVVLGRVEFDRAYDKHTVAAPQTPAISAFKPT